MAEVCPETFLIAVLDDGAIGYTLGTFVQHNPVEAWILRIAVREDLQEEPGRHCSSCSANGYTLHTLCTNHPPLGLTPQPACPHPLREAGICAGKIRSGPISELVKTGSS